MKMYIKVSRPVLGQKPFTCFVNIDKIITVSEQTIGTGSYIVCTDEAFSVTEPIDDVMSKIVVASNTFDNTCCVNPSAIPNKNKIMLLEKSEKL